METLPPEIITQILEYLQFDDRRQMALVNRMCYYASTHPVFLKKELFVYADTTNCLISFKNMLVKSYRKQFCLKFYMYALKDNLNIFEDLTDRIVSLNFDNLISLTDAYLDAIIQYCSNLKVLEFCNLRNICLTDRDRNPMLNLSSITLNNIEIFDFELNIILKVAPNLKDFGIFNCRIASCSQILRRFYPSYRIVNDSFTKYNSKDILTETNIIHHLNNSVCLNSLRLFKNWRIFCQIQPIQLEFKHLTLNMFESVRLIIDFKNFGVVLGQYIYLEQLEILHFPIHILSAISKLYNLRSLKLSYTFPRSNDNNVALYLKTFLESLKELKYIRTLSFNRVIEDGYIEFPKTPIPECTLKTLISLDCSHSKDLGALNFGKNLTFLQIRNGEILEVRDLQLLFKNLTNLKNLCIDRCIVLDDEVFIQLPISNLKGLNTLKITQANLTHRCLQYITNSDLKVLSLDRLSFQPCSSMLELNNNFAISVKTLSCFIPTLSVLECYGGENDFRTLDASNLVFYIENHFTFLMQTYFKNLKRFTVINY